MIDVESITNQIINADCMDILKELPDKCIDLVLTDPPYGINASSSNFMRVGKKTGQSKCISGLNYKISDWDKDIPKKEIFEEIKRVSKNQIIFGGNYFVDFLNNSSCWLVWDKLTGDNLYADCELAYTSFNKAVRKYTYLWKGMLQQDMKNKDIRIHPTQKPLKLFEMILRDYSNQNDLILDCFSGSGTTAVACHNLKRRFICIEKDKDYFDASVERLKNAQAQMKLF
jgi:site-specific DNA-methyltransferase (adenine-specific)